MLGVRGALPLEDAIGILEMGVQMGRVPPPQVWVDSMIAEAEDAALDTLF